MTAQLIIHAGTQTYTLTVELDTVTLATERDMITITRRSHVDRLLKHTTSAPAITPREWLEIAAWGLYLSNSWNLEHLNQIIRMYQSGELQRVANGDP